MRRDRGSMTLETVLFLPILFLLLMGMIEIAKVTYTYFTLQRTLYAIARTVGTSQGANLCDAADETVTAAKNFVLTGSSDGATDSFLPSLQADMIEIAIERYDATTEELGTSTDCDAGPPDFIVVQIPNGYTVTPRIPYLLPQAIQLRPRVRIPYGGT
jgi:hypothetical protein